MSNKSIVALLIFAGLGTWNGLLALQSLVGNQGLLSMIYVQLALICGMHLHGAVRRARRHAY